MKKFSSYKLKDFKNMFLHLFLMYKINLTQTSMLFLDLVWFEFY